uniref:HpcH/HpaI aldolase/citrate lyase domain-containing protein n=1 Tax=Ananas comosus var. bracteatus TaxID=296719 RepID=A0A6V7NSB1_ANACO|nr:unnamed protein product [Ananas comosus var. bracteatus]
MALTCSVHAATLFSSPTPNSPKTLIPKIQPPFSSSLLLRSHRKTLAPIPPKPSLPLLRVSSSSLRRRAAHAHAPHPQSRGSPRGDALRALPPLLVPDPRGDRGARGLRLRGRGPGARPRRRRRRAPLPPRPRRRAHPGAPPPPGALRRVAKKALDLGPQGIMFPIGRLPRAAELAVSYCRFPPRGVRGSAHTVVRASAYGLDDAYLARCEDDLLIAVQVESAPAVAAIESIAAVDGVDVVQMGPLDLSASMGYLWDPGNRKVREAVKDAERRVFAVRNNNGDGGGGPYLGGFAMPHDGAEQLKLRGYHMVAGAVDVGMFRAAAVEDVRRFRSAVAEIGEEDDGDDKPKDESTGASDENLTIRATESMRVSNNSTLVMDFALSFPFLFGVHLD